MSITSQNIAVGQFSRGPYYCLASSRALINPPPKHVLLSSVCPTSPAPTGASRSRGLDSYLDITPTPGPSFLGISVRTQLAAGPPRSFSPYLANELALPCALAIPSGLPPRLSVDGITRRGTDQVRSYEVVSSVD